MSKFEDAFLDLVHRVNDDPIKVFDDALTYVLCQLSTGEVKVAWEHNEEHNKAFADFTMAYLDYLAEQLEKTFWCDAWGDAFMDLAGQFKSFRGQFFTPPGVANLCSMTASTFGTLVFEREVINDCACGSARMLLAAQEQAYKNGHLPPYLIGEDIDGMCCKMAAINLCVHGCQGEVIRHDTLKDPDGGLYGYVINEYHPMTTIRKSTNRADFKKFQI